MSRRAPAMRPASAAPSRVRGCATLVACGALAACASSRVPDPQDAARAFGAAAARGDADALYAMMTSASRRDRSLEDVRSVVAGERIELAEQGAAFQVASQASPPSQAAARVTATARLRYADGEEAALDLRQGTYGVTSAGALPGGGRTPEETLDQLRRVLARRSYAGLMRVLSPATRAAVENDLRSFVEGLSAPATLPVQVTGDAAIVAVPGGHQVKLRRQGGVWRVDDLD